MARRIWFEVEECVVDPKLAPFTRWYVKSSHMNKYDAIKAKIDLEFEGKQVRMSEWSAVIIED